MDRAEEVLAVAPSGLVLPDQAKIGLINQSRGLKCVVPPFVPKLPGGQSVEFIVDERVEFRLGLRTAVRQAREHLGHITGVDQTHGSLTQ